MPPDNARWGEIRVVPIRRDEIARLRVLAVTGKPLTLDRQIFAAIAKAWADSPAK